jgi:hypothetical protein
MCTEYAHTIRLVTPYCCPVSRYKFDEGAHFGVCMFLTCVLNPLTNLMKCPISYYEHVTNY